MFKRGFQRTPPSKEESGNAPSLAFFQKLGQHEVETIEAQAVKQQMQEVDLQQPQIELRLGKSVLVHRYVRVSGAGCNGRDVAEPQLGLLVLSHPF